MNVEYCSFFLLVVDILYQILLHRFHTRNYIYIIHTKPITCFNNTKANKVLNKNNLLLYYKHGINIL